MKSNVYEPFTGYFLNYDPTQPILRKKQEILSLVPFATSTIYNRMSDNLFPPPVKLKTNTGKGESSIAWILGECLEFNRAIVAGFSDDQLQHLVDYMVSVRPNPPTIGKKQTTKNAA